MAQTDHDRMRDAYGTHLLNKHGFDVKTSERMDFYTDNKAIANILSQKEGVEIVYGSLTDIEKSKFQGEKSALQNFKKSVIMRPSVVCGAEDNFTNLFSKLTILT